MDRTLLNRGLLANATFSTLTGLILLFDSAALAPHFNLGESPIILKIVGLTLFPFAAHLVIASRRQRVIIGEILYICALDAAWVLGTLILAVLVLAAFSPLGKILFLGTGAAVACFMTMQLLGLARYRNRVGTA